MHYDKTYAIPTKQHTWEPTEKISTSPEPGELRKHGTKLMVNEEVADAAFFVDGTIVTLTALGSETMQHVMVVTTTQTPTAKWKNETTITQDNGDVRANKEIAEIHKHTNFHGNS